MGGGGAVFFWGVMDDVVTDSIVKRLSVPSPLFLSPPTGQVRNEIQVDLERTYEEDKWRRLDGMEPTIADVSGCRLLVTSFDACMPPVAAVI